MFSLHGVHWLYGSHPANHPSTAPSNRLTAQTRKMLLNMTDSNTITLISTPISLGRRHRGRILFFLHLFFVSQIRINVRSLCRKRQLCQPQRTCSDCQQWWMRFRTFNKYKCHNPTIKFNKQKYHKPSFLSAPCAPWKLITLEHILPKL